MPTNKITANSVLLSSPPLGTTPQRDLKTTAKKKGVYRQHQQWVQKRPQQAHQRAFVTPHDVTFAHLQNEHAVNPDAA
jgi:hypothetical protein